MACFSDDLKNEDGNKTTNYCLETTLLIQSSNCIEAHTITEGHQC